MKMNYEKEKYLPRLADETLEKYLKVFGAISVEGPKWCGKTWTASKFSNSSVFLDNDDTYEKASLNIELVLNDNPPELIDEWTKIPKIWDVIRRKCDTNTKPGNYILTCSTELNEKRQKKYSILEQEELVKLKCIP